MLLAVSLIAFLLVRLVPGDTVTAILGTRYSEEQAEALRQKYGLDKPLPVQYALWLGRVATGDFGRSAFSNRPVLTEIAERLPVTLELAGIALALAILLGVPFGVIAALRKGGPTDYSVTVLGLTGVSIPAFWLGTLMILLFSLWLNWLPSGRFVAFGESPLANIRHMLMPGIALGVAVTAVVMRMTRASMIEVMSQPYIRTAYAKGRGRMAVALGHALKNSLIPVLTILGVQVGYMLAGTIVIEEVFALPGLGRLVLQAINNRDYALLQGALLLIASMFVAVNLVVDLLYGLVNPQIRLATEQR
jgi:peptide/nickel transport system permease protein